MTTSLLRPASPLTRCSSQHLLRVSDESQTAPSPTTPRSNSFVASRRSGVVSEQDALRLAFDDNRQMCRTTVAQTGLSSSWPAAVLRQRSGNCRPRPLSTGFLPSSSVDTAAAQQRAQSVGSHSVKAEAAGADTQLRLQNLALLPNRQLIQQPPDSRWRQWNYASQRKARPLRDVNATSENGWLSTPRSSRPTEQQHHHHHHHHQQQQQQQQLMLEEREAELRAMRSTMEKNEMAILRAMADQRQAWQDEMTSERQSWQRRLRDAEWHIDDVRRTLTERIRELERENSSLQLNVQHHSAHDSSQHLRRVANIDDQPTSAYGEAADGRGSSRLMPVNGVDARPSHCSHGSTGRTDISRSAIEQTGPSSTAMNSESSAAGPDAAALPLAAIPEGPVTRCPHCEAINSELKRVRQEFDAERQQWVTEKRRVIAYQKLLQSKYVELERRCAELESSDSLTPRADHITAAGSYANGHHVMREAWKLGQAQSLLPTLTPFGEPIET